MSPRQRMCESGRIKKSSTELRGFSRLTQTPSSFFLLFLSRTSPDFWVRSVVNSHIAQTHEILRVRLCATHKKTKRLSRLFGGRRRGLNSALRTLSQCHTILYLHRILYNAIDAPRRIYITYDIPPSPDMADGFSAGRSGRHWISWIHLLFFRVSDEKGKKFKVRTTPRSSPLVY
jgi:hypothetical protein